MLLDLLNPVCESVKEMQGPYEDFVEWSNETSQRCFLFPMVIIHKYEVCLKAIPVSRRAITFKRTINVFYIASWLEINCFTSQ